MGNNNNNNDNGDKDSIKVTKLDRLDISERSLKKKKKYLKYLSKHLKETGLEHDKNILYTFELDNAIKIITLQNENKYLKDQILECKKQINELKKECKCNHKTITDVTELKLKTKVESVSKLKNIKG